MSSSKDILKKELAMCIKQLRQNKGLTQMEFYNRTSINIARIETGKHTITIETLKEICIYLEISMEDFFKMCPSVNQSKEWNSSTGT